MMQLSLLIKNKNLNKTYSLKSTKFTLFLSPYHGSGDAMQAFYAEFGELMMRQPVIGLDFQSYLPTAIVPYMLLLVFNVFNRYVFLVAIATCV